jgi:hypothetical protein
MSFYYFMKLTIALCDGYGPAVKAECVDAGVRCYEAKIAHQKVPPYECFKLKEKK